MNPTAPSSSLWAAAAQNSIGNKTLSKPAGLAPGAFSAIAPARSFADIAQSGSGRSIFDAPTAGSNDFDMSGVEGEAAVLGGGFGQPAQNVFGAPRPTTNAFGAPASTFGQPAASAFGQPSQPSANAFGQPSQASANSFGQASQPSTSAFGQPSTSAFGQPVTSGFGQSKPSAFGPGGMGMPATQSAFGPGGMGAPSPAPSGQSAFGAGGMGPPSSASMTFGKPAQSTFGQPQAQPPMAFGAPAQSTFGQPKPSPFAQPTDSFSQLAQPSLFGAPRPAPTAAAFGGPSGTPSPTPSYRAFGSPPPSVPPAPAPAFGMPKAPANNAFGALAASSAAAALTAAPNPPKEVTDAFFKSVFAKKPDTPATPPSAPAGTSTTPQSTPPPVPTFGKVAPPPAAASSAVPSGSSPAIPSFSELLKKSGSATAATPPKVELAPTPATAGPSTPAKEKASGTANAHASTTPPGAPSASQSKEEGKPAKNFSNALAAFAMKKQDTSSLTSGLASFSLGPKKSESTAAKEKEKETADKAEAAAIEAEGKSAEAFKSFRAQDPFERFKQPQQSSWLDAPRQKADWEIKLEEAKKKSEAPGNKPGFDNSAFTTAQLEERRKQRAEEHQLEHDDSDEEQEETEKAERFPEEDLTSKATVAPTAEKSTAKPVPKDAKLSSGLGALSLKSTASKSLPGAADLKSPWKSSEDSESTKAAPATTSVGLGRPSSQTTSTFTPVKSSSLATLSVFASQPSPAAKPVSASVGFNLAKKSEVPPKPAYTATTTTTPSKPPASTMKAAIQPATPAADLPSLGRLSTSTSSKKDAIVESKPVQPAKRAFVGGWPDEPVPKFSLATTASSDKNVESTARELEKARLAIDEGLRQVRVTVETCQAYHEQLKKASPDSKGIEHITDAKRWNFADFSALNTVVNEVQAGNVPLKDKDLQYRRMSVEIDSLVLKAETKKEECARFKRAHEDKDYVTIMRIRHLGPEQSENQTRLRHSSLVVHNQLERLEDYVTAMKTTVIQKKSGSKPLTGPTLDTVNRTIRNLDSTAVSELATLDNLSKRLQVAREAYRAQLPTSVKSPEDDGVAAPLVSTMPNTGSENKVLWVPTSITSARLKRALLATRTTPLLNTMARQFAAGVDSAILDTDLSLAIFNGPLTLDMPPPRDEEPVVTVKAEEAVPEPSKQTPPTPVEVEGDAAKTVLPTPPGAFNFSGPLPAGWEAFKNAPYKPLVIEPPRPGAGRHGHRHASGERSAVKGRESHLKQQSEVAPEQETVSFSNTPSSNAGVGPQTTSLFGTPPVKTDLPPLPPPNAQAQKAPVWPSLSPAAHAPVTPLGSIPPLPRKDFLGSLPPVKKDSIDAPQFLIPANNAPSGFVPLLGKQAQGPTAAELQEKAKQAWGNLGSSKSSSSAPSLTWKPPLPTLPSIPVASAAAAPQLPAAWKAALDAQTKPSTPAAPSRSPAAETTRPSEVERTAESVKQEVKPSAPNATAAVDRLSPPPRIANEPITPSIEQGPPKSPDPSTKKAFDFSSFTKNAAAGPKPSGLPSFSDLLKNSGVSLSSAGVANAEPQVSESDALINAPTTPPQAASPNPSLSGIRSPPLQALFGAKSSAAPKSAFGAGGFGMPTSTPAASASAQSAFGPGGLGIAPASSTSAGAVSTSGQGGSGTHSAAPATSTGFKSAFGPGGVGTPAASDGSTTPPGAKSPSPAPIGGTFGMHSGGASGTFGIAAGPTRSLFAKPEGWTPPASSSSNGNIFKPVNVPIPTGVSGNPDWAKRLANSNADEDEDEDEDEDAEGEEDNSYDDYQDEGDYGAYGRDLSDLEEADEEYEVVDE